MLSGEAYQRLNPRTVAFEKQRGVTAVTSSGDYAYLLVHLATDRPRASQELDIYRRIAERNFSLNLVKLHRQAISFIVDQENASEVADELQNGGHSCQLTPSVAMISVYAAEMRSISGVMGRIATTLVREHIPLVQTADGPDTVFCLVERSQETQAVAALRQEFGVTGPRRRIIVQKFGGRSVGTEEARRLAAGKVLAARRAGEYPVVVVSAIGRMGEPYATDTLLSHLDQVDPTMEPSPRDRDMLMACGEIISTVIMAQTLKSQGLKSVALTGGQAGIITDHQFGDAQIVDIDPEYILKLFNEHDVDAVVVAGFQGITTPEPGGVHGAITTLGRGGSDTTASALGAALNAERVEIYTHVDGVMTADPELVPGAKTLPIVTYEEVCEMAYQGAKVLHPRAAEIAMAHQIPLWVRSSFSDSPGTRVAPLAEVQPPAHTGVTGIATLSHLTYFTLRPVESDARMSVAEQAFSALGAAGISLTLASLGPRSISFIVEDDSAGEAEQILNRLALSHERDGDCVMVSVVALHLWEVPGFLASIARALYEQEIQVLQMADSVGSVSCLVRRPDAQRSVQALHDAFDLAA